MRRLVDPRVRLPSLPKDEIRFAVNGVTHFNDECFVLALGVRSFPHIKEAEALTSDTSIWAYKTVRTRQIYWLDKRLLIRRMFRSTNLCIWQKMREPGFEDGVAATLLVCIAGPRAVWIGNVGDNTAFMLHNGQLLRVTRDDRDTKGNLTRYLGAQRLGLTPYNAHQKFESGDTILLASREITDTISPENLRKLLVTTGDSQEELDRLILRLPGKAAVIKRIRLPR